MTQKHDVATNRSTMSDSVSGHPRLDRISASVRPKPVAFESWKKSPTTCVPSPYSPRAISPARVNPSISRSTAPVMTSAGRCVRQEARMPVPRLVGQAVR